MATASEAAALHDNSGLRARRVVARAADAVGAGALCQAWLRPNHSGGDRRARGPHRADILPPLRRQEGSPFAGSNNLRDLLASAVAGAPSSAAPIEAVAAWLLAADVVLTEERRDHSRRRQSIIAGNPELRDRELTKLAALVPDPAASLTAEAGVAVLPGRVRPLGRGPTTRTGER